MQLLLASADRAAVPWGGEGGAGSEETGHLKRCNKWGNSHTHTAVYAQYEGR
jgi:hypothetical protein